MSEKKRFVQSKYAHHLQDTETNTHYYLTSEKVGCKDLFDEIERLTEENEQLKKRLYLYEISEDEVYKYLRTHPMPTRTNERTITPLDMRHKRY